jgi:hypothetical membrane protein
MKRRVLVGTLLFVACTQFLLFLIIAETQYPDYSTNINYLSDLGVWDEPSAPFFNISVIIFGLLAIASGVLSRNDEGMSHIPWLLIVSGAGAVILGVFPETVWGLHRLGAFLAFIFAASAAVCSYRVISGPFRYISAILGGCSFLAMMLSVTNIYLGLGPGGMERMVLYPILIWLLGFGAVLLSSGENIVRDPGTVEEEG